MTILDRELRQSAHADLSQSRLRRPRRARARRLPDGEPVKGSELAEAQDIPLQFLEHILLDLKHARLIKARRGAKGGYWLARDPSEITVADVIRAVEGPLANIHENAPEEPHYDGAAEQLRDVWIAVRATSARCSSTRPSRSSAPATCRGGSRPCSTTRRPGSSAEAGVQARSAESLSEAAIRSMSTERPMTVQSAHRVLDWRFPLSRRASAWIRRSTIFGLGMDPRSSSSASASACSSG